MPTEDGARINWYNRYWHDWPEVQTTVYEVARAHARYLGCEVVRISGYDPPPGDFGTLGPVMRVRVSVRTRSGKHRPPAHEMLYVDVERRAGKFQVKASSRSSYGINRS